MLELALAVPGRPVHPARRSTGPRAVAVIFDKPTTRTRVSFAVGIAELGGYPLVIDGKLAQIGARRVDRGHRAGARPPGRGDRLAHVRPGRGIEEMAAYAGVPVVNALTDEFHPCQILADLPTVAQHRGGVGALAGPDARLPRRRREQHGALVPARRRAPPGCTCGSATPAGYLPGRRDRRATPRRIAADTGGSVHGAPHDATAAVAGADVVATDTWVSMGQEAEAAEPAAPFVPFRLDAARSRSRRPDAIVLHCLPAYRGKEITAEVLDGPQSAVWDEAENRLHAQKALLTWLLERVVRPRR